MARNVLKKRQNAFSPDALSLGKGKKTEWKPTSERSPDAEHIGIPADRSGNALSAREYEQALMSESRREQLRKARSAGKWLGPTTWVIPALDSPSPPIVQSDLYNPSKLDLSPAEFRAALNLGVYSIEALLDSGELEGRSVDQNAPLEEDTVKAQYTLIRKLAAATREFKAAGPDESIDAR